MSDERLDRIEKKVDTLTELVTDLRIDNAVSKTKISWIGLTAGFLGGLLPAIGLYFRSK